MKKFGRFLLIICIILLLFAAFETYRDVRSPCVNEAATLVYLPKGSSATKVARILQNKGVLRHAFAFSLWCRLHDAPLKAGWYDIPAGLSLKDLVDYIASGKNAEHRITIPEGRATWEFPEYLRQGFPDIDSVRWDSLTHDSAFAHSLGVDADNLEGYLFPATYPFPYGAKMEDIIARMVKENLRLRDELKAKDSPLWDSLGGWHQVLTLASLVEEETGNPDERPLIAGVFLNRLKDGITLGSDPSVRFIFRKLTGPLLKSELDSDSPYNTRKFMGLMPGPISNPGRAAIEAVLFPQRTDKLYFVAKDDGSKTHYFSASLKEHDQFRRLANQNRKAFLAAHPGASVPE